MPKSDLRCDDSAGATALAVQEGQAESSAAHRARHQSQVMSVWDSRWQANRIRPESGDDEKGQCGLSFLSDDCGRESLAYRKQGRPHGSATDGRGYDQAQTERKA